MHAYKQRPDESYIPAARRTAKPVAIDGNDEAFVAHASPARLMHDDLLLRLSGDGHAMAAPSTGLALSVRFAIVIALAVAAWMPIAGVAYLIIG